MMDKRLDEILSKLEALQKRIDNIEDKFGVTPPAEPLKPAAPPAINKTPQETQPSEKAQPSVTASTPPTKKTDAPICYEYKPVNRSATPINEPSQTASPKNSTADLADAIKKAAQASKAKLVNPEISKPQLESEKAKSEPSSTSADTKISASKPAQPKRNIEQIIGLKWMLFVGIAALLIGGVLFFKFAYEQGWISPIRRCAVGTLAAMALLVVGEIAYRRLYRLHAAGLFASGIVWLYYTAWAASPNGRYAAYEILSSNQAFGAMIAVTVIGAFLALRANMISNAIITVVGAMATPLLLSSGHNSQVALMMYLAAVNIAFLSIAWIKRWYGVALLSLAGTILITFGWIEKYINHSASSGGWFIAYTWIYWAIFTAFFTTYRGNLRWNAVLTAGYTILTWLAVYLHAAKWLDSPLAPLAETFILAAAMLIIARLKRWNIVRPVILVIAQSTWLFCLAWLDEKTADHFVRDHNIVYSFAWAFGVLFLADIFWSILRQKQDLQNKIIEFFNSIVAIVSLYAAVFFLYNTVCYTGLDITTAVMGIIALLAAAIIYKRSWAPLGDIYLLTGIALLGIAVPIMFDLLSCTIAWTILGAAAFAASRLFRRPMLIIAPAAMVLVSWLHFLVYMIEYVPAIKNTVVVFNCCELKVSLFTAWGISAAFLACATAMLWPKADKYKNLELNLSWPCICIAVPTAIGFALFQMSRLDATDFAILVSAGITGLSLCRPRLAYYKIVAMAIILVTSVKFIAYDMLLSNGFYYRNFEGGWIILNQQCMTAVILSGVLIWITILTRQQYDKESSRTAFSLTQLFALVTITIAGNYEVTRHFGDASDCIAAVMIWWACLAGGLALYSYRLRDNSTRWSVGAVYSAALLLVAGGYWMYSVLENNFLEHKQDWPFLYNPKFISCLLIAAGLVWVGIKFKHAFAYRFEAGRLFHMVAISGLFLLTVGGSGEAAKIAAGPNTCSIMTTLWWTLWANLLILVGIKFKSRGYRLKAAAIYGPLLLIAVTLRWTIWEVILGHGIVHDGKAWQAILNAQFFTCLLIAAGLVWMNIQFKRNTLKLFEDKPKMANLAPIAAMILITLGGNEEIIRMSGGKSLQMALSLWWGLWATTMLITGFALRRPICRYFAITLYGITLGKVLIVDMQDVETVYRILTFIALGLLLIGCSWLYHRFLRDTVTELTKEPENEQK